MSRRCTKVFLPLVLILVLVLALGLLGACGKPAKDKIVFGGSRPVSGPLSFFEQNALGPIYKMWAEEVNAQGGIYVKEYGKKLPVELKIYDDQSNIDNMSRFIEKLIVEDKVDFLIPPCSTAFNFAAAKIANSHKYILLTGEGGSNSIEELLPQMPYFFGCLNYSNHNQLPVFADIMKEVGAKSAGIIYIDDLHGIEYDKVAKEVFPKAGVQIVMDVSVPADIQDTTNILKQAQQANPDVLCLFTYPDQGFLALKQMIQMGYNPKMILMGPGGSFEAFKAAFGAEVINGICAEGAWSPKSSPKAKEFYDKFVAKYSKDIVDYWGHLVYYAELQCLQQAIEKAGTLDQEKVREVLAKEHFQTVLGDTWFENQLLAVPCYAGQIGQWQNGEFEVIDPGDKRTANPIYPKPEWPKQ